MTAARDIKVGATVRVNVALTHFAEPHHVWLQVLAAEPYPGGVALYLATDQYSACNVYHVHPATEIAVR